ncbi:hypothetical protein ACT453_08065, partial [Bacillus sp. D-CC]
ITIVTNKMTNVTIISTVPASPDTSLEKVTIGVKNGIYELTIANVLFGSNNDLRLVSGEAGTVEIIVTLVILLVTIVIVNMLTSRIYVNGVMNYSDKVKFKDLAKFIKRQ